MNARFHRVALLLLMLGWLMTMAAPSQAAPPVVANVARPAALPPASQSPQAGPPALPFSGSIGGQLQTLVVSGTLAYVSSGVRILVFDVSQPDHMTQIGAAALHSRVDTLHISGSVLYAHGGGYLTAFDVSDPTQPTMLWQKDLSWLVIFTMHVVGATGYAFSPHSDLNILDLSDPADVEVIGTLTGTSQVDQMVSSDSLLYLHSINHAEVAEINVYDISDRAQPVWRSTLDSFDQNVEVFESGSMVADGDYMYIAGPRKLTIFDLSDPDNPQVVSTVSLFAEDLGLPNKRFPSVIVGQTLVTPRLDRKLALIDISNRANPSLVRVFDLPGEPLALSAADGTIYAAFGEADDQIVPGMTGFLALDVGQAMPQVLGTITMPGRANALEIAGNRAYVTDCYNGITVIDITTPQAMRVTGAYTHPESALIWDLTIHGQRGLITYRTQGDNPGEYLGILDLSQPDEPHLLGSYRLSDAIAFMGCMGGSTGPQFIQVIGDYAYVRFEHNKLSILDISDGANPAYVRTLTFGSSLFDFVIQGNIGYMPAGMEGLLVLDLTDPVNPSVIGEYRHDNAPVYWVQVVGDSAYVNGKGHDIDVLEMSDRTNPQMINAWNCPGDGTMSMTMYKIEQDLAYMNCGLPALLVVDVADPDRPRLRNKVESSTVFRDLEIIDGHLFAAASFGGLLAYQQLPAVEWQTETVWLPVLTR